MRLMERIQTEIRAILQDLFEQSPEVLLTRPEMAFGDLTTNVALQLGQKLGLQPREVAEKIAAEIRLKLTKEISEVTIAGPGFINLRLTDKVLLGQVHSSATIAQSLKGKTVVTEYSDPNPFKVLHAGHLYTTVVGDAVSRLLEAAGATVHRLNFGGDVGLHVGRAMWAIIKELDGENPAGLEKVPTAKRLEWLSSCYVEGTSAYEASELAKAEIIAINKRVYAVHAQDDHDSAFAKIYWTCREWSYQGFDKFYEQLQVSPFEKYVPESEVTAGGIKIVEEGLDKGVFVRSEGAVVFVGEEHGLHTRVFINSNGLPTYEAKDLGLAALKWQDYHFDLNIIITGNDIVDYMKVVIKALSSFYPEVAERTKHLTHGMVKLPSGAKMSSRKGNILLATDIIEAAQRASREVAEHASQENVLAAIKYAFLKNRIGGDIVYDPIESLSLEGNSGPYLQYAHARACGIFSKAHTSDGVINSLEAGERGLALKLTEFPEVVEKATHELTPHLVCTYLYELAQVFNRFYEQNRVLDDPRQSERLSLVESYAKVLKTGLELLGITAPERM